MFPRKIPPDTHARTQTDVHSLVAMLMPRERPSAVVHEEEERGLVNGVPLCPPAWKSGDPQKYIIILAHLDSY